MYRIKKEKIESIKDGVAYVEVELWVSDAESIPAADGIDGRQLVPGSIAIIPSESSIYVLDFDSKWKEWKEQGSATTPTNATLSNKYSINSDEPVDTAEMTEEQEEQSELEDVMTAESVIEPETAEKDGEADVLGDT